MPAFAASISVSIVLSVTPHLLAQTAEIQKQVQTGLEFKRLEGTWVAQSVNRNDKKQKVEAESLVVKGDTFQQKKDGKTVLQGRLNVDPTEAPKSVDLIPTGRKAAKTSRGVYRLDGDRLTICLDLAGTGRPPKVSPGLNRLFLVYRREK